MIAVLFTVKSEFLPSKDQLDNYPEMSERQSVLYQFKSHTDIKAI